MEDNEKRNEAVEEKEKENVDELKDVENSEDETVHSENKKSFRWLRIIIIALIQVLLMLYITLWIIYEGASSTMEKKPIIYIYPEEEQEVKVTLLDKDLLTCSYPKYEKGWDVIAKPNGDLVDLSTGNKLYSLYYESNCKEDYKVKDEGFCVKKEDIVSFLEEKLEILGLNYKEKEEFIVYWLPQLEKYDYVYIRFADENEISKNMGLGIDPKPDTLIRVMMVWKGLNNSMDVKEQELDEVYREGYTVVEWGGAEIND